MSTSEIRTKLHELIDKLDGRFLKAIYQMVSVYQSDGGEISDDEKATLDARIQEHEVNPTAGRSWQSLKSDLLG